jgi:pimeloyl-ACP methyl ester carboxylesterase
MECRIMIAFTLLALSLYAAPTSAVPAAWTEGYVLANGIRIHYWRTGGAGKPAMVMAHGSSDDGWCWTQLAKELTSRYDLILYDARGPASAIRPSPLMRVMRKLTISRVLSES